MIDIKMSGDGELSIGPDGDFMFTQDDEQLALWAIFLLRTTKGDYKYDSNFGANLEEFIGQPLNELVMKKIQDRVYFEFDRNDMLPGATIYVNKSSTHACLIVIEFSYYDNVRTQITVEMDMKEGKIYGRVN